MGKKDKEHRKRVQARNTRIKAEEKKRAKIFEKFMNDQLEAMKMVDSENEQPEVQVVETPEIIEPIDVYVQPNKGEKLL